MLSPSLHPIIEEHLQRLAGRGSNASLAGQVKAMIEAAPFDAPPGLADVAQRLELSVPTLNRRLAAQGTGWRKLVHEHRMETAARLLRTSRRNVSMIALDVGFAESASFTRAFARHFGVAPGRYRKGGA